MRGREELKISGDIGLSRLQSTRVCVRAHARIGDMVR